MSDRLRNLLETIDRALYGQGSAGFSPAHELLVSGWMLALQKEIAEREAPPPVSLEALRAWVRTKANAEPGERFKGLPERWLDNPTWRCLNGHVSKRVLKTEAHGDLCLACRERLVFTFPEDKDGQIEAPPPVLEEGLAKIAKQLESVGAFFHTVIYKPGGEPVEATVTVNTAAGALRALALRGARPATRAEWLAIAADLAQDEGVVTEGLARAVASLLPRLVEHESVRGALLGQVVGPWGPTYRSSVPQSKAWHRCSLDSAWDALVIKHPGFACFVAQYRKHGTRETVSLGADFPTLREAMLAADAALRSEGRILLGGLPEEVASGPGVDGVTCYACAGPSLRTRGVVVDACPVCGGARTVPRIATPGPAPEVETFGEVARRALESVRQLPDDPQPDASWLQETTELSLDRWWYRGTVPPVDVSITGASALDALLSWLTRRLLLASWREVPSLRGSYTVEIVTRAPLDLGAREGM